MARYIRGKHVWLLARARQRPAFEARREAARRQSSDHYPPRQAARRGDSVRPMRHPHVASCRRRGMGEIARATGCSTFTRRLTRVSIVRSLRDERFEFLRRRKFRRLPIRPRRTYAQSRSLDRQARRARSCSRLRSSNDCRRNVALARAGRLSQAEAHAVSSGNISMRGDRISVATISLFRVGGHDACR